MESLGDLIWGNEGSDGDDSGYDPNFVPVAYPCMVASCGDEGGGAGGGGNYVGFCGAPGNGCMAGSDACYWE